MKTFDKPLRVDSGLVAEIIPLTTATWHIARCNPGREFLTVAHLATRRFGCYMPLDHVSRSMNGKDEFARSVPLFPGYIFVWLWGLPEHIGRLKRVPGIAGLLVDGDGVPVLVPDPVMRHLHQEIEFKNWIGCLPRSFFRRRRRYESWIIPPWRSPNHGFSSTDPEQRIATLQKALGL